jgi:hypothetical protein
LPSRCGHCHGHGWYLDEDLDAHCLICGRKVAAGNGSMTLNDVMQSPPAPIVSIRATAADSADTAQLEETARSGSQRLDRRKGKL